MNLDVTPIARCLSLYLVMLREWATQDRLDEIDEALRPPLGWRDPVTGLPAGWVDDEEAEWAEWERARRS